MSLDFPEFYRKEKVLKPLLYKALIYIAWPVDYGRHFLLTVHHDNIFFFLCP